MKKLIPMIGVAAFAFGAYAADLVVSGTSFEKDEGGCSGTALDLALAVEESGARLWYPTNTTATLTLKTYDDDAYVYGTGDFARREEELPQQDENNKYLSLETAKGEPFYRTLADSKAGLPSVTTNVFIDTLVQFTGFEEEPTIDENTKIAVWMKAIEAEGEDPGETNLYVTAGLLKDDGTAVATPVKIPCTNGTWQVGKWYRLTVKSVGEIVDDTEEYRSRNGFLVYVDGVQVEGETSLLSAGEGYLASDMYALGTKLFPSCYNGETDALALSAVGFEGTGAIDDLVIDDIGPAFAQAGDDPGPTTINLTLTWDANVAGVSYTIDGEANNVADLSTGSTTVKVAPDTVVTVAATAKDWYKVAAGAGDVTVSEAKTVEITTVLVDTTADAGATGLDGVSVAEAKEWADAKEITPAQIAACDFALDAYLMNVDLSVKPEMKIVDIVEVEGGWMITIKGTAGEADIDLGNINGVLRVKSAATLDALATADAVAYDIDVREAGAAIKVAGDNKNFMQAVVTK